jgi:hypothetical protein
MDQSRAEALPVRRIAAPSSIPLSTAITTVEAELILITTIAHAAIISSTFGTLG